VTPPSGEPAGGFRLAAVCERLACGLLQGGVCHATPGSSTYFGEPTLSFSPSTASVEGSASDTPRQYGTFVAIALGSTVEVRHLLRLAIDLQLPSAEETPDCRERSDHVVRAL
jgi:hypothetical protein